MLRIRKFYKHRYLTVFVLSVRLEKTQQNVRYGCYLKVKLKIIY